MNELETIPLRFRVWDKRNKKFIRWCGVDNFDLWLLADWMDTLIVTEFKEDYDVSQDTGLVDKNDIHIFTGDVVRCKSFDNPKFNITGEVIYTCEACWITTEDETHKEMLGVFFEKEVEVISNIWEGAKANEKH